MLCLVLWRTHSTQPSKDKIQPNPAIPSSSNKRLYHVSPFHSFPFPNAMHWLLCCQLQAVNPNHSCYSCCDLSELVGSQARVLGVPNHTGLSGQQQRTTCTLSVFQTWSENGPTLLGSSHQTSLKVQIDYSYFYHNEFRWTSFLYSHLARHGIRTGRGENPWQQLLVLQSSQKLMDGAERVAYNNMHVFGMSNATAFYNFVTSFRAVHLILLFPLR